MALFLARHCDVCTSSGFDSVLFLFIHSFSGIDLECILLPRLLLLRQWQITILDIRKIPISKCLHVSLCFSLFLSEMVSMYRI